MVAFDLTFKEAKEFISSLSTWEHERLAYMLKEKFSFTNRDIEVVMLILTGTPSAHIKSRLQLNKDKYSYHLTHIRKVMGIDPSIRGLDVYPVLRVKLASYFKPFFLHARKYFHSKNTGESKFNMK